MRVTTVQAVTKALDSTRLQASVCPPPPTCHAVAASLVSSGEESSAGSTTGVCAGCSTDADNEPLEPPECTVCELVDVSTSTSVSVDAVQQQQSSSFEAVASIATLDDSSDKQTSSTQSEGQVPIRKGKKNGLLTFFRQLFSPKSQHNDLDGTSPELTKKRLFHYGHFDEEHQHSLVSCLAASLSESSSSISSGESSSESPTGAPVDLSQIPLLKAMPSLCCKFDFSAGKLLGRGGSGTVRLVKSPCCDKVYAVKSFKKRKRKEAELDFVKRITLEYLIGSALEHPNIAETVDMIKKGSHWYQVMPFYDGGDLYTIIKGNHMTDECIDCVFKQLLLGVAFLHSKGIAHRDLKPENLLMASDGFIKITDFGISDLFITPSGSAGESGEDESSSSSSVIPVIHKSKGLSGSTPYIAPEEFTNEEFDPRAVDVWSCAVIYYAMTFHSIPWEVANAKDPEYSRYLSNRKLTEEPFVRFASGPQHLLFKMLDPNPITRITIDEILNTPWFKEIKLCVDYPEPFALYNQQANCSCSLIDSDTNLSGSFIDSCSCSVDKVQHFHFSSHKLHK